jgi:hypothetical protein
MRLNASGQQKALLLLDVCKLQLPELNLDVNNYRSLCFSWTCSHYRPVTCKCLHNRGPELSCTWIRLDNRSLCCSLDLSTYFTSQRTELDISKIPEAYAAPGHVYTIRAWAAPAPVWTKASFDAPGRVYTTERPELHLDVLGLVWTTKAGVAPEDVYTAGACRLSCTWTAWTTGTFAAPECMCPQGPEPRLDLSTLYSGLC